MSQLVILTLCLLIHDPLTRIKLPGSAAPEMVAPAGGSGFWVIRQKPGAIPELWFASNKEVLRVSVGNDVQFVAMNPDRPEVTTVGVTWVQQGAVVEGVMKWTKRVALTPPLPERAPMWRPAQWLGEAAEPAVILGFTKGVGLLSLNPPFRIRLARLTEREDTPWTAGMDRGITITTPTVTSQDPRLIWCLRDQWFATTFDRFESPVPLETPKLLNMQNAICIPEESGGNSWLVYGGSQGDFDSFGWQLRGKESACGGEGILTQFGPDPGAKSPRIVLISVSNSLSSHMIASLRGKTPHRCTVVLKKGPVWKCTESFSFYVHKEKIPEHAVRTISWNADLNEDGFGDLVVSGDRKEIRVFLSRRDGSFDDHPMDAGASSMRVFTLPHHICCADPVEGDWRLEFRK